MQWNKIMLRIVSEFMAVCSVQETTTTAHLFARPMGEHVVCCVNNKPALQFVRCVAAYAQKKTGCDEAGALTPGRVVICLIFETWSRDFLKTSNAFVQLLVEPES